MEKRSCERDREIKGGMQQRRERKVGQIERGGGKGVRWRKKRKTGKKQGRRKGKERDEGGGKGQRWRRLGKRRGGEKERGRENKRDGER